MIISIVTDEMSGDPETAFELGLEWGVSHFELRGVYGQRVPRLSPHARHRLVRATGRSVDVAQPQPMPAGVSDSALGMEVGPEPGLPILMVLVGIGLLLWQRRSNRRLSRVA